MKISNEMSQSNGSTLNPRNQQKEDRQKYLTKEFHEVSLLEEMVNLVHTKIEEKHDLTRSPKESLAVIEILERITDKVNRMQTKMKVSTSPSDEGSCPATLENFILQPPILPGKNKDLQTDSSSVIENEHDKGAIPVSTNIIEKGCSEKIGTDQPCPGGSNRRRISANMPRRLSHPLITPLIDIKPIIPVPRKNSGFSMLRRGSFSISPLPVRMTMSKPTEKLLKRKSSSADNWKKIATDAFNIIDGNGDGFLQKEEVTDAIAMMQENGMTFSSGTTPAELAETMVREVDTDGDGLIDMDEFIQMMKENLNNTNGAASSNNNNRMSQLAKNVLLAHQKKMENSVIGNDTWMIHPLSNIHAFWDILVSILILLTVLTMPLTVGWDSLDDAFFVMNLVVDIIFMLDVCKNFCTGIIDENDAVIMDKKIVRKKYLAGFFFPDMISSFPLDIIFKLSGSDGNEALNGTKKSFKFVRITKLFRLVRLSRLFSQLKDMFLLVEESLGIHISDGFTKLLRLFVGALILGHWIGCFNFMLVRIYDFPEDSWVVYANLHNEDTLTQWSWSLFKALAQMIMIGFETPPFTNASCDTASHWCGIEHWITLCCLYLGAVFYSLLISSISSILQTANLASRQFEEKLMQIDDYMRHKKLPAAMREKVKEYFHLQHSNGKLYNESEILKMLTPILRREIKNFNGRDVTVKVPLLSSVTARAFSEEMSMALEPLIVFENEVIIREKTTGEEMFFINSGVIELFVAGSQNTAYVAIGDGCFFGEASLLLGIRRSCSARTKTQCMLYRISKLKLLTVLQDFPDTLVTMKKVAVSRVNRLQHYVSPEKYGLKPEDEVDSEDRKTELFGVDAEEVMHAKAEENSRFRLKSRHSHRHALIRNNPIFGKNRKRIGS